ncbi:MAG: hypothetical protein K2X47_18695, partial [Bdellovibrionales bacterium]|nr:hypothetical protein [Bdellovibrionales bacterium]
MALCLLIGGVLLWQRSRLPEWIATQIKTTVNHEFLMGTKAELRDLRFEADFWSFLFGEDGQLSFQLTFGDLLVRGKGPIKIHLAADKIQFQYTPEVSLRTLSSDVALFDPAIKVTVSGNIPTARPSESALGFQIDSTAISAPQFYINADFSGRATASTKDAQVQIQGKKFSLKFPSKDFLECTGFEAQMQTRARFFSVEIRCREFLAQSADEATMLILKNQQVQFELDSQNLHGDLRVTFGDAEALVGPVMFQTDRLKADTMRFQFEIASGATGSAGAALQTNGLFHWGPLRVKVRSKQTDGALSASLDWTLKPLNLIPVIDPVVEEIFKKKFKVSRAHVEGTGVFDIAAETSFVNLLGRALAQMKLKLSLDVESQKSQWRALGIGVALQSVKVRPEAGLPGKPIRFQAALQVDDFGWRGVGGRLYPSQFQIQIGRIEDLSKMTGTASGELKVAMKEIDARIAPLRLALTPSESGGQKLFERLQMETALQASTESVSSLFEKVCLPWPTQWKTALNVDWKKIELKGGSLRLDGDTKIEVIGGKITTGPVTIENILSSARTTRFSTWIRGLQLRDLGAPINFGE